MSELDSLLFGIGSDYGDDRVGWRIVELIGQLPVPTLQIHTLRVPWELLNQSANCQRWILVDALADEHHPGTVHYWQWPKMPRQILTTHNSHDYSLFDLLALAESLGRLPPVVDVWGVAVDPNHCLPEFVGEPLTPLIESAVQEVVRQIASTLNTHLCSCEGKQDA